VRAGDRKALDCPQKVTDKRCSNQTFLIIQIVEWRMTADAWKEENATVDAI
jgi:hypothetical protein